jgi:hypothetical protein
MTLAMLGKGLRMPIYLDRRARRSRRSTCSSYRSRCSPSGSASVWRRARCASGSPNVAGARHGVVETVTVLARYALATVGFLLVLQSFGVDVRSLAILASVLGVGLGFGLQKHGEQLRLGPRDETSAEPIEPGDFVDVGRVLGHGSSGSARAAPRSSPPTK